jgi:hypothetical protein
MISLTTMSFSSFERSVAYHVLFGESSVDLASIADRQRGRWLLPSLPNLSARTGIAVSDGEITLLAMVLSISYHRRLAPSWVSNTLADQLPLQAT